MRVRGGSPPRGYLWLVVIVVVAVGVEATIQGPGAQRQARQDRPRPPQDRQAGRRLAGQGRRAGMCNPGHACRILRSSGRPTMPGASPTTSTHTGPGSEPTSRPSTSFWLIHNSTLFQPTHARTSLPTGRHRKGPSVPLATAVQAVPAIADDCSEQHSRTFRRQPLNALYCRCRDACSDLGSSRRAC